MKSVRNVRRLPIVNPMSRSFGSALFLISAGLFALLSTSCAEQAGSGKPVTIPAITVNCQSSNCLQTTSRLIFVYITTSNCSPDFLDGSSASSSVSVSCTAGGGCRSSMGPWTLESHETGTQIPSGTYTVCGYVDVDGSNSPTSHDTTIELDNISFTDSTSSIVLGTGGQGSWVDHP